MEITTDTISVILAAGRGTRMKDFRGNKTLLPLLREESPYKGHRPILLQILDSLPPGPKAVVVHYRKKDIMEATRGRGLTYCDQPDLNGTGGALLSARTFLEKQHCGHVIITMGDVPLVKKRTYLGLARKLGEVAMAVLGFRPIEKRQYGVLDIQGDLVRRIIEWKYWKDFPEGRQRVLQVCNSGIYAAKRDDLLRYLSVLASKPHVVQKERDRGWEAQEEFFVTDIVEYMSRDGLPVGYVVAGDETEVMGIDDLPSLVKAQEIFMSLYLGEKK